MKYMGSKNRIAKHILPIILKDRKPDQWYVEPFCGGCNTIDKVGGLRIANDSHYYLICLLDAISTGWISPDYVSEEQYKEIKNNKSNFPPHLVGFVGFCCSFGSKWFGGFARNIAKNKPNSETLNMTTRNYCDESKRNLLKQAPNLKGIKFTNQSYLNMEIPENSIIYCDPPYQGTTGYKDKFDHDVFWNWCRKMSEKHTVYISEYTAPDDFESVWEIELTNSIDRNKDNIKKPVEKLFKYKLAN